MFVGIGVLVGSAGVVLALDIIELDRRHWMLDINLKSVFLMSRAAIPPMLVAGHGAIFNTGTLTAVMARGGVAYGASKAGVLSSRELWLLITSSTTSV
ncbi:MAG: SDR family NAD(P)-dependent oxidoreductase [Chloroflexi bacterium]|nr:SDR family NAD(P)-dependent oxidoreductase [Chloroflexota bacterium]